MEHGDLDELKELMPQSKGLEAYYDACVVVLRATFSQVSEAFKDIQLPEFPSQSSEASAQDGSHTAPGIKLKEAWYPWSGRPLPPGVVRPPLPPMLGTGFHHVEVTRLGPFALIAFQWQEAGEVIFVYTVDLRTFVNPHQYAVGMAATIVEFNLLERLGPGWYQHAKLRDIRGLTFME